MQILLYCKKKTVSVNPKFKKIENRGNIFLSYIIYSYTIYNNLYLYTNQISINETPL